MAGDELTLTIHGLPEFNELVDGEVFARKLFKFMQGLAAADEASNGKRRLKYLISELTKNTATASVREQVATGADHADSGIDYYARCADAIYHDTPVARTFDRDVVKYIADINKDVGESFALGEIKRKSTGTVIRIDAFLAERAQRVLADIERKESGTLPYYKGIAHGSFVGELRVLDSLATAERAVLILTAGGAQIECIVANVPREQLTRAYRQRCTVTGTIHYNGESGLPQRIDATTIEVIEPGEGLTKWRGAFRDLPDDDGAWE